MRRRPPCQRDRDHLSTRPWGFGTSCPPVPHPGLAREPGDSAGDLEPKGERDDVHLGLQVELPTLLPLITGTARRSEMDLAGGHALTVASTPQADPGTEEALTPAERRVADAVLRGASNQEIAQATGRSVRTIANQLAAIYRKLGVGSRAGLAARLHRS